MRGYQRTEIIGNAGRDAELRYTPEGIAVLNVSVAVNRTWTRDGEKHEKVTWFRVTMWRQLAEALNPYIKKGTPLFVAGHVEARAYTDNSGQPAASLELTADEVTLLGSNRDAESEPAESTEDIPF